ncbi:MAG TPA: hypothetical protein VG733_13320 [Chthoniobacteraceae bacterium]|nr:hypothetical protein [Chthoniobacteraceae bacterium]
MWNDANGGDNPGPAFPGRFESCRARALTFTKDFAECRSTPPKTCMYRLAYGMHCYCYHPNRGEIIKQSQAS